MPSIVGSAIFYLRSSAFICGFNCPRRAEEVEVASLVRLQDVLLVEPAVAALVVGRRRLPAGAALRHLRVRDAESEPAGGHVELDEVAVADEGERAADR